REVRKRSRQPIDFVDDDSIDFPGSDVAEKAFECGPLHIASREPAIIVDFFNIYPPFMLLAVDVCDAGLALRFQRVERLLQALFRGFSRIQCTTNLRLTHRIDLAFEPLSSVRRKLGLTTAFRLSSGRFATGSHSWYRSIQNQNQSLPLRVPYRASA